MGRPPTARTLTAISQESLSRCHSAPSKVAVGGARTVNSKFTTRCDDILERLVNDSQRCESISSRLFTLVKYNEHLTKESAHMKARLQRRLAGSNFRAPG